MKNKLNKIMAIIFAAMISTAILSSAVNLANKRVSVVYEAKYKPLLSALGTKNP
jgi:hypothetical protein